MFVAPPGRVLNSRKCFVRYTRVISICYAGLIQSQHRRHYSACTRRFSPKWKKFKYTAYPRRSRRHDVSNCVFVPFRRPDLQINYRVPVVRQSAWSDFNYYCYKFLTRCTRTHVYSDTIECNYRTHKLYTAKPTGRHYKGCT